MEKKLMNYINTYHRKWHLNVSVPYEFSYGISIDFKMKNIIKKVIDSQMCLITLRDFEKILWHFSFLNDIKINKFSLELALT